MQLSLPKNSQLGRWIRTDLGIRTFQGLGKNSPAREQVVRRITRDLYPSEPPPTWPHQTCPVSTGPFLGSVFRFQSFPDLHASNSIRTLFRSSFRLRPKIPYLIPEFTFLSFSWVLRAAGSSVFSVFSAFSGFQGSKSGFRFFRLFRFFHLFRFSGVQIRNSGFSVFSAFRGSKPGIPGSRLRPRLVQPRLARTESYGLIESLECEPRFQVPLHRRCLLVVVMQPLSHAIETSFVYRLQPRLLGPSPVPLVQSPSQN